MEFSSQLKEARTLTGLSQRKLAERYGIPRRSIDSWESGERVPPIYKQESLIRQILADVESALEVSDLSSVKGRKKTLASFRNKIICGDAVTVMRTIPSNSIDLVLTSPPYNLRSSKGTGMREGIKKNFWRSAALYKGYDNYQDNIPYEIYVTWQRECLREMWRVLSDNGAIFYNHKWRVQNGLLQDRADILNGFPVRQIIIWQRAGGMNFNRGYFLPTYEVIYLIAKPAFKLRKEAVRLGDVWKIQQERKTPHPAPFPLELAERIITSTDANIVLDCFNGSGTTTAAAQIHKRDYIGIDISEKYCEMAKKRLAALKSD